MLQECTCPSCDPKHRHPRLWHVLGHLLTNRLKHVINCFGFWPRSKGHDRTVTAFFTQLRQSTAFLCGLRSSTTSNRTNGPQNSVSKPLFGGPQAAQYIASCSHTTIAALWTEASRHNLHNCHRHQVWENLTICGLIMLGGTLPASCINNSRILGSKNFTQDPHCQGLHSNPSPLHAPHPTFHHTLDAPVLLAAPAQQHRTPTRSTAAIQARRTRKAAAAVPAQRSCRALSGSHTGGQCRFQQ